jgi:hypothetical protein
MKHATPSRRQLLQMGAAVGGSLLAGKPALGLETDPRKLGAPLGPYGERSPFEKAVRWRRESNNWAWSWNAGDGSRRSFRSHPWL